MKLLHLSAAVQWYAEYKLDNIYPEGVLPFY